MTTTTTQTLRTRIIDEPIRRREELTGEQIEWAIDRGYAVEATVFADITNEVNWRDDWRSPEGCSWPGYTMEISVNGTAIGDVGGWNFCGPDRDGKWDVSSTDGAYDGRPVVKVNANCVYLEQHDGTVLALPNVDPDDERMYVYGLNSIRQEIKLAAAMADHGDPPCLADADSAYYSRRDVYDAAYLIQHYLIVPVRMTKTSVFPDGEDADGKTQYLVTGYAAVLDSGERLPSRETEDEAINDAVCAEEYWCDGEYWYETLDEAQEVLDTMVQERLAEIDDPPGMTQEYDGDGVVFIESEESGERYHLDADEVACVCRDGHWHSMMETLAEAFGRMG